MGLIVRPLHVGSLRVDKSLFTMLHDYGQKIVVPILAWYVEGADACLLVDTAAPPPPEAPPSLHPYEQPPEQHLIKQLASLGLRPEDVEIVILTHLHWDHCLNAHLFPKARFVVQRAELRYAAAPLPIHYRPYGGRWPGARAFLPPEATVQVIEGDQCITKGVSVLHLPGHTPGIQGVAVETDAGVHLIAGDNVPLYDNWQGDPPMLPHIPSTLHVNLEDYFASFAKMERVADVVLPSHDRRVLAHPSWPADKE